MPDGDVALDQLADRGHEPGLVHVGRASQLVDAGTRGQRGEGGGDARRVLRQPVQPAADDAFERAREREAVRHAVDVEQPPFVGPGENALFNERLQRLDHEQRVSPRRRVHPLDDAVGGGDVGVVDEEAEHLRHFGRGQAAQLERVRHLLACEMLERALRLGGQILRPPRQHEEDRLGPRLAEQTRDDGEAGGVGPVEVIEDDQKRRLERDGADQVEQRIGERRRMRGRHVAGPVVGLEARQQRAQQCVGRTGHAARAGQHEQSPGQQRRAAELQRAFRLGRLDGDDEARVRRRRRGQLVGEARLADARGPRDQRQPCASRYRGSPQAEQVGELAGAADELRPHQAIAIGAPSLQRFLEARIQPVEHGGELRICEVAPRLRQREPRAVQLADVDQQSDQQLAVGGLVAVRLRGARQQLDRRLRAARCPLGNRRAVQRGAEIVRDPVPDLFDPCVPLGRPADGHALEKAAAPQGEGLGDAAGAERRSQPLDVGVDRIRHDLQRVAARHAHLADAASHEPHRLAHRLERLLAGHARPQQARQLVPAYRSTLDGQVHQDGERLARGEIEPCAIGSFDVVCAKRADQRGHRRPVAGGGRARERTKCEDGRPVKDAVRRSPGGGARRARHRAIQPLARQRVDGSLTERAPSRPPHRRGCARTPRRSRDRARRRGSRGAARSAARSGGSPRCVRRRGRSPP